MIRRCLRKRTTVRSRIVGIVLIVLCVLAFIANLMFSIERPAEAGYSELSMALSKTFWFSLVIVICYYAVCV